MFAADGSYAGIVKALLKNRANPNLADEKGQTALMFAWKYPWMYAKEAPVFALLRDNGANLDATDGDGNSILMRAASSGDERLVETLLASGADVSIRDRYGKTALDRVMGDPSKGKIAGLLQKSHSAR